MNDLDLYDTGDLVGAGLGWRRVDTEWDARTRREQHEALLALLAALAPSSPKRRKRRPTLESQVKQLFRAARASDVAITVTIEAPDGVRLTVTPVSRKAAEPVGLNERPDEPPRRSLFTTRAVPKQKVVL